MAKKMSLESQMETLKEQMPDLYEHYIATKNKAEQNRAEADLFKSALAEASTSRSSPLLMEPGRNYVKEIVEVIAERTKGTKEPEIFVKDGELAASFDNFGPRYWLRISAPQRRLKARTGPRKIT